MSLAITFKSLVISASMLMPEEGENLAPGTKEAYNLYKTGNIEQAITKFQSEAKAGDEAAIFALGALLREGQSGGLIKGSPEDYFLKAAEKDYAPAQFNLGKLMIDDPERGGNGVAWMRKAAENGSRPALLFASIGSLDGSGGFERDPSEAFKWLTMADERGIPEAKFYLGRMYQAGYGLDKDLDKARALVIAASENGVDDAMLFLAASYLNGSLGEKSSEKALEIYRKGAGRADGRVYQLALGGLYEAGSGVEKDYSKALFWYDKAVSNGEVSAYNKLGFFHERGMGVPVDEEKALGFYKRGAEAGVAVSMYNVAQMLDGGKGVSAPDKPGAARWLHKAALSGMALAQLELSKRYITGEGLMQDSIAAAAWLERAAVGGSSDAQLQLAQLLEGGEGFPRSLPRAARWYQAAAVAGKPEAMFRMGQLYEEGIGTQVNRVKAMGYYSGADKVGYAPAKERLTAVSGALTEEQRAEATAFRDAGFKVPVKEGGSTE